MVVLGAIFATRRGKAKRNCTNREGGASQVRKENSNNVIGTDESSYS